MKIKKVDRNEIRLDGREDCFSNNLVKWYRANQRTLPWRDTPSPYRVWISEIMLQQTQVATVIPYFERFMKCFPSIKALADSQQQHVLKAWEGLGYYSRARNLLKAAQLIVNDLDGVFPSTFETLKQLPGVGDYTAAAIASIAFNESVPVVDGNVLRVYSRHQALSEDIALPKTKKLVFSDLQKQIIGHNPSDFNQAIMELGALICRPSNPLCEDCPLSQSCEAFRQSKVEFFPIKSKAGKTPCFQVAVGIIRHQEKILIQKRSEKGMLGGLWELPGAKIAKGKPSKTKLLSIIKEKTSLDVKINTMLPTVSHVYSHFSVTVTPYICDSPTKRAESPNPEQPLKWVTLAQVSSLPFSKVSLKIFDLCASEIQ